MHLQIDMMDLNQLRAVLAKTVGKPRHSPAQSVQSQLRLKKTVWAALLAISAGWLTGWIIEPVCAAEAIIQYHIPAQSLNNALLKFAADSHLELIFSADWVRGVEANALIGAMSPEQALEVLLKNTGFSFRFLDAYTVILFKQTASQTEIHDAPTVLEALTVVGRSTLLAEPEPLERHDFMSLPSAASHYQVANISSATRTDTPIKQIPQSIQAINRSLIDDQQSLTVSEVLGNISSVVPRNSMYTPVVENTLVRGFRAEQLIDGFTQYYNPGDRESTVNIQQIEVLKGSNAVLYSGGSGAPVGGVINVISKLPQAEAFAEAGFKMGSYSFYQPYIDWNQPFGDSVLFRLTGEYTDSASSIDILETQRFNINPVLTITDNDSTRFTLQGKVSRWRQPDYQGLPATGTVSGDFRINPRTFIGPSDMADSRSDSDAVWASLDKTFNQTWSLNLKARYAQSSFDQKVQSLLGGGASFAQAFAADLPLLSPSTWGLLNAELYQQQQELNFLGNLLAKFNLGPTENQLLLGADHSDLHDDGFTDFVIPSASVNLQQPHFETAYQEPGPGKTQVSMSNVTYGGYVQWQSTVFERFHQLFALRLGGLDMTYADQAAAVTAQSRTETLRWLPRVGSVVDINDAVSVFACYSEGMRGQPFVKFASAPAPELSRQLEAGVKLDVNHWLSGQLAVYQIDRDHVAVNLGSGFVAEGKQRSQGFELDLTWQPLENLDVLTSYGHTDAEFVEALPGIKAGNRLALAPQNAGRVWANYRLPSAVLPGLSMGFGVYLRDAAFLGDNNQFKAAGYHSFDAAIAYETSHYKLAASAKNLSNETYFQAYDYLDGRVAPSQGASVYVTLSVKY